MERHDPPWTRAAPIERSRGPRPALAVMAGLAIAAAGFALAACQGGDLGDRAAEFTATGARITGDPVVSARV